MSKEMAVIVLGIWTLVVPYLGVPGTWRTVILVATGAVLMVLGFLLRAETLSRGGSRAAHGRTPFVESTASHNQRAHEQQEGIHSFN